MAKVVPYLDAAALWVANNPKTALAGFVAVLLVIVLV